MMYFMRQSKFKRCKAHFDDVQKYVRWQITTLLTQ